MSKYVIDIPGKYYKANVLIMGTDCGKIITEQHERNELPELTAEYVNEHFGDLHEGEYEVAYQKGLDDAWEAARKLFSSMADSDIEKAFPIEWNNGGFKALMNLQPQEAIAKLQAYEETKKADSEIKVGDEIEDYDGSKYVVEYIDMSEKCIYAVHNDGHTFGFHGIHACKVKKTGRHFPEVADLLKAMKEVTE